MIKKNKDENKKPSEILRKMKDIGEDIFDKEYDPEFEEENEKALVRDLQQEGFSLQEEKFINEYFIDFNEKEAVIRSGYSVWNAARIAKRLMESPKVAKEVKRRRDILKERYEISPNRVLEEYAKIAYSNPNDLMRNGKPLSIGEIPVHVLASINSFETYSKMEPDPEFPEDETKQKEVFYFKKIKQYDKKGALDSIAKHLDIFGDNDKVLLEYGLQKLLEAFPKETQEQIKLQIMQRVEGKILK